MATKERQKWRRVCFALVLTAVIFRFAGTLTFARPKAPPQEVKATEQTYPTMYYTLQEKKALSFLPQDGEYVTVKNRCGAEFQKEELLMRPLDLEPKGQAPLVLIVHTHATEAYTMTALNSYEESSAYRTADRNYNVVRVGKVIADRLNKQGIVTLHDTSLNDLPGYNGSYGRMEALICRYLEEYPSIRMVIDVHRDAVSDGQGGELALRSELEGQSAAQLLLVMGTDLGGSTHPHWQTNLSLALKLQVLGEKEAPGLFRKLSLCASRYNQHLTPYSMLLEVGTAGNTLEEALISADFFAQQLARLILERS